MKKFNSFDAAAILIWLLPAAYIAYIYPSLPVSVPVHFGLNGTPDKFGSRREFLSIQAALMVVSAFVYLLLKVIAVIDPKKMVQYGETTFKKLALGIVLFVSALCIGIVFSTTHQGFGITKVILPITGLLFAFIGNIMNSIKPNYFAGVRTPWTLENEDNWRATHRLAGKVWFTGGILLTAAVLLLPAKTGSIVFISITGMLVLIPVVYSYVYYKKHQLK